LTRKENKLYRRDDIYKIQKYKIRHWKSHNGICI